MKNHDFTPKNLIFSNFMGGGGGRRVRPPLDQPLLTTQLLKFAVYLYMLIVFFLVTGCITSLYGKGPSWSLSYGSWIYNYAVSVQSVPITTKVVSSNPDFVEVYSIQHYVIKFVSDFPQVGAFFRAYRFPPPVKLTAITLTPFMSKALLFC